MSFRDLTRWKAPPIVPHELERLEDGRRRCSVCGATWARKPQGQAEHCPRVPLYLHSADVPVDLVTRDRARRRRLAVDPVPVAVLQVQQPGTGHLLRVELLRTRQAGLFAGRE